MTQAILINPSVDPQRNRSAHMAKGLMSIPFPQQCTVPVTYGNEEYLFVVDSATVSFLGLQWELLDFLENATDTPDTVRLPHDDVQVVTATYKGTQVSWLAERD